MFGGATGAGSDLLTAVFLAAGKALLWSTIQANLVGVLLVWPLTSLLHGF